MTVGPKHYKIWKFRNKGVKAKKGRFGKDCNIITCVTFNESDALCGKPVIVFTDHLLGTIKGDLQVWKQNKISQTHKKLHKRAIDAVYVNPT